ncbi:MAG: hypothetical protein M0Z28_28100 [Rhodospirillales bacterium]|nr:hypothetical protein [Rhodospirillales bacterium]
MTIRRVLLAGTAIRRVVDAIRWWELWFLEPIRSGRVNDTAVVLRLAAIRDPMFFRLRWSESGLAIECAPHLTSERLRIRGLPMVPADRAIPAGA